MLASRLATNKQMMRMLDWGVLIGTSISKIFSMSALVPVRTTRERGVPWGNRDRPHYQLCPVEQWY